MKHSMTLVFLGLSLILSACDKAEDGKIPKMSTNEIEIEIKEKLTNVKEKTEQERAEFILGVQKEMDEVNAQMEKFTQYAEKTTGEAQLKLNQKLQALQQERYEVEQKISEIKSKTSEKWQEMKAGVTEAIKQLRKSVNEAEDVNA
jgi:hypothetical protein